MSSDADDTRPWAAKREGFRSPLSRLAASNRRRATDAERRLWRHLRTIETGAGHFRRQVVLGRYIADFACHGAKLIIEVDGGQHCDSAADAERTRVLEASGWRVIRFWNNEVLNNLDGVAVMIAEALTSTSAVPSEPPPPLTPPRKGEGDEGAASFASR